MDNTGPIDIEADFQALAVDPDDESAPDETGNRFHTINPEYNKNSASEVRELQRVMLNACRDDSVKASEKAQCARAYRDLEVLRMAKLGKPLVLTATMKAEAQRSAPSPIITLSSDDEAKIA